MLLSNKKIVFIDLRKASKYIGRAAYRNSIPSVIEFFYEFY